MIENIFERYENNTDVVCDTRSEVKWVGFNIPLNTL